MKNSAFFAAKCFCSSVRSSICLPIGVDPRDELDVRLQTRAAQLARHERVAAAVRPHGTSLFVQLLHGAPARHHALSPEASSGCRRPCRLLHSSGAAIGSRETTSSPSSASSSLCSAGLESPSLRLRVVQQTTDRSFTPTSRRLHCHLPGPREGAGCILDGASPTRGRGRSRGRRRRRFAAPVPPQSRSCQTRPDHRCQCA